MIYQLLDHTGISPCLILSPTSTPAIRYPLPIYFPFLLVLYKCSKSSNTVTILEFHLYRPQQQVRLLCSVDIFRPLCSVDTFRPLCSVDIFRPLCSVDTFRPLCSVDTFRPLCSVDIFRHLSSVDIFRPEYEITVRHLTFSDHFWG